MIHLDESIHIIVGNLPLSIYPHAISNFAHCFSHAQVKRFIRIPESTSIPLDELSYFYDIKKSYPLKKSEFWYKIE